MDKDQTGTIDWWEFLNHEALKIISANRSKVSAPTLALHMHELLSPSKHFIPMQAAQTHMMSMSAQLNVEFI